MLLYRPYGTTFTLMVLLILSGCPAPKPAATSTPPAATPPPAASTPPTETSPEALPAIEADGLLNDSGDPLTTLAALEKGTEYELRCRFVRGEYNDAKDADLSKLYFQVQAEAGSETVRRTIVLADREKAVDLSIKLNICTIKVAPLISKPEQTAGRTSSAVQVTTWGGYRFTFLSTSGAKIGYFDVVDTEGPSQEGIHTEASWSIVRVPNRKGMADWRYEVFDVAAKDVPEADPLFALEPTGIGEDEQQVVDPTGNIWEYKFPVVRLKIYPASGIDSRRNTSATRKPERERE
jgi:hypothetical protein